MNGTPPFLNGLRAFEAAARHGSFKAAAGELHVTPAAISQSVRLLERRLGYALFQRHANGLDLTEQGRALQPGLTDAFAAIGRLVEQVSTMRAGPMLTVGVAPAFALHWLIPRLAHFNLDHPEVEVRIATGGLMNPLRNDWTCTIRRGDGDWPGYSAKELFASTLVPVCTPTLAKGLRKPQDLRKATLIVVTHLREQWAWWFKAAGLRSPIKPKNEVRFESSSMAMQAVLDGVGVAVAQLPYVSDALKSGRLIAPFHSTHKRYESWYLAYRPAQAQNTALKIFRDWLVGEANAQSRRYRAWF